MLRQKQQLRQQQLQHLDHPTCWYYCRSICKLIEYRNIINTYLGRDCVVREDVEYTFA